MRGKIEVAVVRRAAMRRRRAASALPKGETIIMPELTWSDAKYSVVLRSDIPALEAELLSHFCGRITSKTGGGVLLHFLCTEIALSHPCYVEMTTFKLNDEVTRPMKIPHHYVFLISEWSDSGRFPIGFDLA
jgi:hypothetical protein